MQNKMPTLYKDQVCFSTMFMMHLQQSEFLFNWWFLPSSIWNGFTVGNSFKWSLKIWHFQNPKKSTDFPVNLAIPGVFSSFYDAKWLEKKHFGHHSLSEWPGGSVQLCPAEPTERFCASLVLIYSCRLAGVWSAGEGTMRFFRVDGY